MTTPNRRLPGILNGMNNRTSRSPSSTSASDADQSFDTGTDLTLDQSDLISNLSYIQSNSTTNSNHSTTINNNNHNHTSGSNASNNIGRIQRSSTSKATKRRTARALGEEEDEDEERGTRARDTEEEEEDDSDFLDLDLVDVEDLSRSNKFNILLPATPTSKSIDGFTNLNGDSIGGTTNWPFSSTTGNEVEGSSIGNGMMTGQVQSPNLPNSPTLSLLNPVPIPASSLPHEILLHILRLLPSSSLSPALLVCKAWCQCGVELLWHKPSFSNTNTLVKMLRILEMKNFQTTFNYSLFIKRLNFSTLSVELSDRLLNRLLPCIKLERLTLAGCNLLNSESLVKLISNCSHLVALDLTEVKEVDDEVVIALAENCKKLQGLNLSGCNKVTDIGLEAVARNCPAIRRVILSLFISTITRPN